MITVASFYAPRPEHPFFQDYAPFLNLLRASCERYGHRHVVLTDDAGLGPDAYVAPLPRSLMRAVTAAQHAWLADPANATTPTLLVGADCVLAQDPEPLLRRAVDGHKDLGITVGPFADCRMNTGMIYVPRPAAVAHIWADALVRLGEDGADERAEWGDDQRALLAAIDQAQGDWPAHVRVAELPVDPWNLAPEHPDDDCRRGVVLHFRGQRKAWMADYCREWLRLGDGVQIRVVPNTDTDVALAQIVENMRTPREMIAEQAPHGGVAVLVGSGPSAADDAPHIRALAEAGAIVFGLNGAVKWLFDAGVAPHFGVMLDMREGNRRFVEGTPPRFGWIMASHCHPSVVAAASAVALFHHDAPDYRAHLPPGALAIGGGPTVGISAMYLACILGFRRLELFGYDSSFREGQTHLLPQPVSDAESRPLQVHVGPRVFATNFPMYGQAATFEPACAFLYGAFPDLQISVHGDGLLPAIARQMIANATAAEAA